MLDLSLNATIINANRSLTLSEKFNFQIQGDLQTQNIKNVNILPNAKYNENVQYVDMIVMTSSIPVNFIVDGILQGNGKFFALHKTNGINSYEIGNTIINGFTNLSQSTITYDYSTKTVTLSPTSSSYTVMLDGVQSTISDVKTVTHIVNDEEGTPITPSSGHYYFYLDETLTLMFSTAYPTIKHIPVMYLCYNKDNQMLTFFSDERDVSKTVSNTAVVKLLMLK